MEEEKTGKTVSETKGEEKRSCTRYLVCVDESKGGELAILQAGKMALRGDTITLLHGYTDPSSMPPSWAMGDELLAYTNVYSELDQIKKVQDAAASVVLRTKETLEAILAERGVACEIETIIADRSDVRELIVETVKEKQIGITLLGSRGLGTIKSLLLGSVSTYVMQHSPSSVLVVRPAPWRSS